jgi:hypothetical protein
MRHRVTLWTLCATSGAIALLAGCSASLDAFRDHAPEVGGAVQDLANATGNPLLIGLAALVNAGIAVWTGRAAKKAGEKAAEAPLTEAQLRQAEDRMRASGWSPPKA